MGPFADIIEKKGTRSMSLLIHVNWSVTASARLLRRLYCLIGWRSFSLPQVYGQKAIVESHTRRDVTPFLDIGPYLCPSDIGLAPCVR